MMVTNILVPIDFSEASERALDYAASLQVPFVFSSNGKSFVFHDKTANESHEFKRIQKAPASLALPRL